MAREFSVVVGINATKAVAGGRQFKAGADQVNRSNRGMQRSTARTTKRMTAMITTMGRFRGVASLMFAGFLGVGGIGAVIRTLAQFETKISQVTALISAQSPRSLGGAMAALSERARELGATTLFTATQAAEGMRFLSLAGFDALEVYQAIGPALTLATVGMLDLGVAADIVSNIMSAFSIDASETEDVVNGLAFTASRTNTSIQQLGEAMKFVGPVAGALGIDVKETSVALGILGNSGLQASLAGTSLRRVMSGLLNPSKQAKKVFSEWGVTQEELVSTMTGENGLVELVDLLAKKGINAADAFLLFGQRGAPGLLSLVNQRGKLRELTNDLQEMGDIAAEQAAIIADNLGGDARLAISALQEAILQLGDSGFGDWLREVTQSAAGFIREMTGVETPAEKMTSSMKKGAARAQTLKENLDLLKLAAFTLAGVLLKNVVVGLVRSAAAAGANITLMYANAVAMGAGTVAANALTFSLNVLKGVMVGLGIGAILVGIGYLLQWAVASDDTAMSTEELTEAMEDQRIEAEKLVFTFDLVGEAAKRLAVVKVEDQLMRDKVAMEALNEKLGQATDFLGSVATQSGVVKDAQAALNAEVEGTEAWAIAKANVEGQTLAFETLRQVSRDLGLQELEAEFESLSLRIANGEDDLIGMRLVLEGKIGTLKEYREGLLEVNKALEEQRVKFEALTGITQNTASAFAELQEEANPSAVAIAKVQVKLDLFNKIAALTADQLEELKLTEEDLAEVQAQLNTEMTAAEKIMSDTEKASKKLAEARKTQFEKLQDLRDGTKTVAALTREYTRELAENALAVAASTMTVTEFWEAQKILKGILEENIVELEKTCKKTDDLTKCMSDNAKAMQTLWDQALRNIQDSFADAFRGAFESSSDFFDSILDAFKDMISQMLAAWAISGIANLFSGSSFNANGNSFSGIFSQGLQTIANRGAGGGATTGGGTGNGGIFSSTGAVGSQIYGEGTVLGDAFASFSAGATAFFQGAGALVGIGESAGALGIANTGIAGFGTSGASIAGAGGSASAVAGNLTGGAAIGIITGIIADQLLGSRGDPTRLLIFTAIGGAIGAYYGGAIGAVIGGAIGGLVDNIFGGAKKLEKASVALSVSGTEFAATQTEVVSTQRSWFRGKKFATTNRNVDAKFRGLETAFTGFAIALDQTAEAFGGFSEGFLDEFSANLTLDVKNMSTDKIAAALEGFMRRIMLQAIEEWLGDVEGIDAHVHSVLSSFSDNLEDFARAVESLLILQGLLDVDLIDAATTAIAEGNIGVLESYQRSVTGFRGVIEAYDGSIESLELLAQATAIFTATQVELIAVYQNVGREISNLFGTSAQTIREQLLSEEELYNLRRSQIDDLVEQSANTVDPEELSRLAAEINRLGLDAFGMLDADQQAALGPEFIEFFDGLGVLFGDQITSGISQVVQDQADLDLEVATRLDEAAQAIIAAAEALEREARQRQLDREDDREGSNREQYA